jgi:hypothetical protein
MSFVSRGDLIVDVSIDTTPLAGTQGYIAFDLLRGDPLQDNTATVSDFVSTGTLGDIGPSGDVTGSLTPGPLVLTADQFFNEWLEEITYGAGVTTFQLDLTTVCSGGVATPDEFEFFLFDENGNPLPTSDPTGGDAVFAIEITGASTSAQVFSSADAPPDFTASVTPETGAVPEPAEWPMTALAMDCWRSGSSPSQRWGAASHFAKETEPWATTRY